MNQRPNSTNWKSYQTMSADLKETAEQVQSEKLSVLLSDAAATIDMLVAVASESAAQVARRARHSYALLRTFADALHHSANTTDTGYRLMEHSGACTDDAPTGWAHDCARCLAVKLAKDQQTPPVDVVTPAFLLDNQQPPEAPPKKHRRSAKRAHAKAIAAQDQPTDLTPILAPIGA